MIDENPNQEQSHNGHSSNGKTQSLLNVEAVLRPHHIEQLRESGLSDDTILACGFRSITRIDEARIILQHKTFPKKCGASLCIPYFSPAGRPNGCERLRPDTPRVNRKGGAIKYESRRGQGNRAYFPPLPAMAAALKNPQSRLLFTEGEKKAAAACQHGFATIGLAGVFAWKGASDSSDGLIADLDAMQWRGRDVVVLFDSDLADNPNVQDAESRLAAQLRTRGAKVRVARLPSGPAGEKVGLDDYLLTHDAADLHQVINDAIEPEPVEVIEKIKASAIDPIPEARRFKREFATRDGVDTLHHWRAEYYGWTDRKYVPLTEDELRSKIYEYLDAVAHRVTRNAVADLLGAIQAQSMLSSRIEMPAWLHKQPPFPAAECLVTRSSILHVPTAETCPLDPRLFSVNSVDFGYDPAAECPQWLEFLAGIWSEDRECVDTLQEIMGYLLLPDTSQQKIFLLVGPKRSGKGTIGRIIGELIGRDNCCAPTLGRLAGEFGAQPLLGKTAAIVGDARLSGRHDASAIAEALLSISGEDQQTVNRKNLPMVNTQLRTRFVLLTNELPRFTDASATLPSRFVILNFTKSFYGREDNTLTARLNSELPGILNWAIAGYRRLNERGFFIQPASSDEAIGEMEELASPMTAFLRDCCEIEPGTQSPVSDVWTGWRRWCARIGRHEGNVQSFGRDLRAAAPSVAMKQTRAFGGRVRVYEGLRLVDDGHDDESERFYG